MAQAVFAEEDNLKIVQSPVTICGNIHGQLWDLLELFRVGGECPDTDYIFMGGLVDRGLHSTETIQLLFALKVRYPERITLIRGNHESRSVTMYQGLYDESLRRYGNPRVWQCVMETFDMMPIAALVDNKILCVHGGLSPQINVLSDYNGIDRKMEVPGEGPMF